MSILSHVSFRVGERWFYQGIARTDAQYAALQQADSVLIGLSSGGPGELECANGRGAGLHQQFDFEWVLIGSCGGRSSAGQADDTYLSG
jgi:hypothetical protein